MISAPTKKGRWTTYYTLQMQALFNENQQNVQSKPYANFFNPDLVVPLDMVKATQHGSMPQDKTFAPTRENIQRLFDDLSKYPRTTYGVHDDGVEAAGP